MSETSESIWMGDDGNLLTDENGKPIVRQWLEAHRPLTVADLSALDAEIEKRKKPRRWRLDYSRLTQEELLEFRALIEKAQVPDEGEGKNKTKLQSELISRLAAAMVEVLGNLFDDGEMKALRLEIGYMASKLEEQERADAKDGVGVGQSEAAE